MFGGKGTRLTRAREGHGRGAHGRADRVCRGRKVRKAGEAGKCSFASVLVERVHG